MRLMNYMNDNEAPFVCRTHDGVLPWCNGSFIVFVANEM